MHPEHRNKKKFPSLFQTGFTLIELLVVLAIMGVVGGLIIANFAGQRPLRNLRIAQNEMVSNFRKVKSYSLSSRNLPSGQSVQYYVLKFDAAQPNRYTLYGLYNVKSPPAQLREAETMLLPQGVRISPPITVSAAGATTTSDCVLVAFQMPFAKQIVNTSCSGSPPTVASGDDFDKILTFVANNGGQVSSDSVVTITLADTEGSLTRQVSVNGITGLVTAQ